jgi:hypothetical protein
VAVTMTDSGEILYASFPIDKMETTADGDLMVYGKASDGGLDSDQQIVDPGWMSKAVQEWLATGGNVRESHNPQRPIGKGVEASTDSSGASWVKSLVVDPLAQKLASKGVLTAYSVGIARPTIVRDGTAPGGRITAGELVEISLVDRPANKRCGIQLVKSVDGHAEYVNDMFGTQEDIAKALGVDVEKMEIFSNEDAWKSGRISMTPDMSVTFTPDDLMKIMQNKFVEKHYDELAFQAVADQEAEALKAAGVDVEKDHREFSAEERRHQASQGHSLPDGSYPIPDKDALRRAAILARSGHGNVSGARALIARRARELGVANPLDSDDAAKYDLEDLTVKNDAAKEVGPEVTKDPADGDGPGPADKKMPKKGKGKKLPPWLNQNKADTPDSPVKSDDSAEAEGEEDACKEQHAHTEKCMPSGTPQSASGAKDAAPMQEIPNTSAAPESPMPAGRKTPDTKGYASNPETAAMLRFKTIGIDTDLGRLHDLTCPAYHPDDVAKYHPFADFKSVVDTGVWQRKAIDAACGPLQKAMQMTEVWQAAETLKGAAEAELNDYRLELHKAFRDANPGPTSYPSPGCVTPNGYNRPLITEGHSASSPGHSGPNTSSDVATSAPSANSFNRPPLSSGHETPSPAFMKNEWEYPKTPGVPQSIPYAYLEKEKARRALSMMHDHLAHAFPLACPMLAQDAYRPEGTPGVPATVGVGKSAEVEAIPVPAATAKVEDVSADFIEKAKKKMRKKLGKKVLAGKMTVDEARTQLGRNVSQKAAELEKQELQDLLTEQVEKGLMSADEALARWTQKSDSPIYITPADQNLTPSQVRELQDSLNKFAGPRVIVLPPGSKVDTEATIVKAHAGVVVDDSADIMKAAVSEALSPLVAKIQELEAYKAQSDERFERLANLADPATDAFTGIAMNPVKKAARPAGVPSQAEIAERTQQMMIRQLQRTARISDNGAEREAAYAALEKYQSIG